MESVCVRLETNGAPYFATDKHMFSHLRTLNAIKWNDYVKACTTEHTWRHAHEGQTPSARTQSHSHTDERNGPGLRRLTFAGSHLGRGKLSQVLLYVVQNSHWVLVWTGFQSVPSAHCGCGHTQTHTQQKHARTHTHTRTWMPRYEKGCKHADDSVG